MASEPARERGPLFLVDASIYIFQAHFSPNLTAEDRRGEDQSAFMGFARFLLRFLRITRPERLAVAFDESLFCGFRHQLYPEYKSNRVLPDENLARQLKACAALCEVLGVAAFGSETYEADDIIGTLACNVRAEQPGQVIRIVSRDKDLAQLLQGDSDELWDFHRDLRRTRHDIITQYGISPEQFPCYLGLTGDTIDCIPGVPGVGPVAARALLRHFEAMVQIYNRIDEVPQLGFRGARTAASRLLEHQQQAELSRRLATIVQRPPVADEDFCRAGSSELGLLPLDPGAWQALMNQEAVRESEQARLKMMLEAWQS